MVAYRRRRASFHAGVAGRDCLPDHYGEGVVTRRGCAILAILSCAFFVLPVASAQPFPARPITVIVPFSPGGASDFLARYLAQKVSETAGWRMVVENKTGASGHIGTEYVAKAEPNGYTLIMGPSSTHAINPSVFRNMRYDVQRDFIGITMIGRSPNLLAVNPAVPASNLNELIAHARANPGKVAFSSSGTGTSGHLSGEMIKFAAGIDLLHVPYKGPGPSTAAALSGEVQLLIDNIAASAAHVKAGKLRAIAVTSLARQPILPDVPTLDEAGLRGFELQGWFGMFAPSATPRAILQQLNDEFVKVLNMPDTKSQFAARGIEGVPLTLEQFATLWKSEIQKYAAVVKRANIVIE